MRSPRSRRLPRPARRLVRATAAVWPVAAGILTAVGVVGAAHQYGPLGLFLVYVGAAAFTAVMIYAAFAETTTRRVPIVRISAGAALALVVALGVVWLFPISGWIALAVAGITSPVVTGWLAPGPVRATLPRPAADTRPSPDQALVDRVFERMVSQLDQDRFREADGS